jgi:hypothetical protein
MARSSIEIALDLQDRDAQRKLKDLSKSTQDLDEDFGDAESAGERMARAIEQSAADMITEIDDTKRAVDRMDAALEGTDLDAKSVVADLKRIGLTADDIEQDADQLAAALRRAGDVQMHASKQGFDDVGQAVGHVRDETDRAKGAMTGFAGGVVGEMPGVANALGPVGEGLGQLAEGALEGEIGFKHLALAGGAMAGVAIVMNQVAKASEAAAAVEAFRVDEVEDYVDALGEADTTLEGIVSKLRDAETVELVDIFSGDSKDITADLAALGLTVDEFAALVEGGAPKIEEYADAMRSAGVEGDALKNVVFGASQQAIVLADAQEAAAAKAAVFDTATSDLTESTEELAVATDELTQSEGALDAGVRKATKAIEDSIAASKDARAERRRLASSTYDARDAEDDFHNSVEETTAVLADATATDREKAAAIRNSVAATDEMISKQLEEQGVILDSERGQREWTKSMTDSALYMGGPLGAEILAHIGRVNGIPEEKITEAQALVDKGSVDAAKELIDTELDKAEANPTVEPAGLDAARARIEAILGRAVNLSVNTHVPGGGNVYGGRSHTGSRFAAGETKQVVPGQVFTPDVPGRMASVEESRRMLSGSPAAPMDATVTLVLSHPDTVDRKVTAAMDRRDAQALAEFEAGIR